MKLDEYIAALNEAGLALESAPQKGFVDLDQVKKAIAEARQCLLLIAPRLNLGEKLIADFRAELLARIKALKISGGVALVSQAESLLSSGDLNYDSLISLRREIDQAIGKIFSGRTLQVPVANSGDHNIKRSYADFR